MFMQKVGADSTAIRNLCALVIPLPREPSGSALDISGAIELVRYHTSALEDTCVAAFDQHQAQFSTDIHLPRRSPY